MTGMETVINEVIIDSIFVLIICYVHVERKNKTRNKTEL